MLFEPHNVEVEMPLSFNLHQNELCKLVGIAPNHVVLPSAPGSNTSMMGVQTPSSTLTPAILGVMLQKNGSQSCDLVLLSSGIA